MDYIGRTHTHAHRQAPSVAVTKGRLCKYGCYHKVESLEDGLMHVQQQTAAWRTV